MSPSYVAERLAYGVLSLLVLSLVVFGCTQLLPGDAATMILGDTARPEALAELRRQLGLERPWALQYLVWLGSVASGDLGRSLAFNQPVAVIVWPAFGKSLTLAAVTLGATALVGISGGVVAAIRRGRPSDAILLAFSYAGIAVPEFILGPLLILGLARPPLQFFPSSGYSAFAESPLEWLRHLVLPVLTLTAVLTAHVLRQTRSAMLEVLKSTHVRAARLHGLSAAQIVLRHVVPNGLSSAVAVLAIDMGYLMGSIVIVEEIFAYPGLGRTTLYGIANRDLQLVQGCTLLIGLTYIASNLVADLVQGWLDPRLGRI